MQPRRYFQHIFDDENAAIDYLLTQGCLDLPSYCEKCGENDFKKDRKMWKCTKSSCRKKVSMLKDSFFAKTKLKVNELLEIGYYWLAKVGRDSIVTITGHSPNTITNAIDSYRQLVADTLDSEEQMIGGKEIIVEIDEAKFGKRKYNRGHRVEGSWVLGGVERTDDRNVFLVEVSDLRAETLLNIINRYVRPGSIIYTDCFSSYTRLSNYFTHFSVNHSQNFKDPITGCHTNHIEGTWCGVKMNIRPRQRTTGEINHHLGEFIWRRRNFNDIWTGLIHCFSTTSYA
jgi:transposase-like protein